MLVTFTTMGPFARHSCIIYLHRNICTFFSSLNSNRNNGDSSKRLTKVMRMVPQPVVVVTSAVFNEDSNTWVKRGVTCSSFTSISFLPPIVSFAVTRASRMHSLLMESEKFAVHVLAKNQVAYGVHFSNPAEDDKDQFEKIPHEMDEQGVPVIRDSNAVVFCKPHSIHTIGDHHVWYGEVLHAYDNNHVLEPLLYYARSFRSIGDETFIQAFEDTTLPFVDWTHEAHLRMAWNYIREYGTQEAIPYIKNGIKNYNETNKHKINRGYHETVTMFFIHLVSAAINSTSKKSVTRFEEFIAEHPHLLDNTLLYQYYSDEQINKVEAKAVFVLPDKKDLPS